MERGSGLGHGLLPGNAGLCGQAKEQCKDETVPPAEGKKAICFPHGAAPFCQSLSSPLRPSRYFFNRYLNFYLSVTGEGKARAYHSSGTQLSQRKGMKSLTE